MPVFRAALAAIGACVMSAAAAQAAEPPGRYSHCTVLIKNSMYTFGGRGFSDGGEKRKLELLRDMWAFDAETSTWRLVHMPAENPQPGPRSSHACAASHDGKSIYLFGGMRDDDSRQNIMDDLWRFDVSTEAWTQVEISGAVKPTPRSDHSLVVTGERFLYVIGGCDNRAARTSSWRLDLRERKWLAIPFGEEEGARPASGEEPAPADPDVTNATAAPGNAEVAERWLPGARCAQTAAALPSTRNPDKEADVLVFGGRVSVTVPDSGRNQVSEEMWASLSDAWVMHAGTVGARTDDGVVNATAHDGLDALWEQVKTSGSGGKDASSSGSSDSLLLNRSDHAAVLHDGRLFVFGGLFTDLDQRTVYIMKDLVALDVSDRSWERLAWGPTWRFGHTMVDDPARKRFLLYGGAGGMDVYNDVWAFSYERLEWSAITIDDDAPDYPTLLMSILMGGAGFILCMCMLVSLLFLRTSHRLMWHQRRQGAGGAPGTAAGASRGASADAIAALPVSKWAEVKGEFDDNSGGGASQHASQSTAASAAPDPRELEEGGGARAQAPAASSSEPEPAAEPVQDPRGPGRTAADDERSVDASLACAVCLCEFDDDEEVVRLPCRHIFHKDCIHRWLHQEGSCPNCRRKIDGSSENKPPSAIVLGIIGPPRLRAARVVDDNLTAQSLNSLPSQPASPAASEARSLPEAARRAADDAPERHAVPSVTFDAEPARGVRRDTRAPADGATHAAAGSTSADTGPTAVELTTLRR